MLSTHQHIAYAVSLSQYSEVAHGTSSSLIKVNLAAPFTIKTQNKICTSEVFLKFASISLKKKNYMAAICFVLIHIIVL